MNEKDYLASLEKLKLKDEALLELEERERLREKPSTEIAEISDPLREKRSLLAHLQRQLSTKNGRWNLGYQALGLASLISWSAGIVTDNPEVTIGGLLGMVGSLIVVCIAETRFPNK